MTANVTKCSEDVLEVGECVANIFNELLPGLRKGDPELNIPPYDPFLIDRLSFQYSSGVVNGRISVRNVELHGFGDLKVEKVNVRMKDKSLS